MAKDFRYNMPDGTVVEAFQMTPATRYQEKDWPDWMNSKWLMTVDGEEWLNVNDKETVIPALGWIVKLPSGAVTVQPWQAMEHADKVVKDSRPVHPPAEVDEEKLLELGSKLTGKSVEELREEQLRQGRKAREAPPADNPPVDLVEYRGADYGDDEPDGPTDIILELCDAYEDLVNGEHDKARVKFRNILSQRVAWCQCPPGQCAGLDPLVCRQNSPLTR